MSKENGDSIFEELYESFFELHVDNEIQDISFEEYLELSEENKNKVIDIITNLTIPANDKLDLLQVFFKICVEYDNK